MRLGINNDANISSALKHSNLAIKLEPNNIDMKWITELLLRQQRVEQFKREAQSHLKETLEQPLKMPEAIQVSVVVIPIRACSLWFSKLKDE